MWTIFKVFIEFFNILLKFYVLGFGHEAYGILALQPGIKPTSPTLEGEVFHFTSGSLGKSVYHFGFFRLQIQVLSYDICLSLRNRYLKRSLPFHLLKLSYTTRILWNAFVLFSGVLPSVVFTVFSATGPQMLMIAVFTLAGTVVLLLLIALLVLRYLPANLRCSSLRRRGGWERGIWCLLIVYIHRKVSGQS